MFFPVFDISNPDKIQLVTEKLFDEGYGCVDVELHPIKKLAFIVTRWGEISIIDYS